MMREFNNFQPVHGIALSPDGKLALSGDAGSTLVLWDADKGEKIRSWQRQPPGWLNSLAFSPDGTRIVCSGGEDLVFWDVVTGKEVRRLRGHARPVYALAFSPDGKRLASAGQSGTIRLWDIAAGKEIHRFEGHNGPVYCVAFSPGGGRLVSSGADRAVRLWGLPR
jgi:WD40 repeat protein